MSVNTILQFYDSTHFFSFCINHCKRFGNFTNLHSLYGLCNFLRNQASQLLHFKTRGRSLRVSQQTVVVACIFILRYPCSRFIKSYFSFSDIVSQCIQFIQFCLNFFLIHTRLNQNMAIAYTVTTLFNQLSNMITIFCFKHF